MGKLRSNALAAATAAAIAISAAVPAQARGLYEDRYSEEPEGAEMLADVVLVRPVTFLATAVGAVGWVVSLPFSILGGNTEENGQVLIAEPFNYTFARPVGYMEEGTGPRRPSPLAQ